MTVAVRMEHGAAEIRALAKAAVTPEQARRYSDITPWSPFFLPPILVGAVLLHVAATSLVAALAGWRVWSAPTRRTPANLAASLVAVATAALAPVPIAVSAVGIPTALEAAHLDAIHGRLAAFRHEHVGLIPLRHEPLRDRVGFAALAHGHQLHRVPRGTLSTLRDGRRRASRRRDSRCRRRLRCRRGLG